MRFFSVLFIAIMLLCMSLSAKGEGKCPAGQIQTPGPENGVINCMPLPGTGDAPSRENGPGWSSRWGAIAIDFAPSNVGIGVSVAAASKRRAKKQALAECRAKGGQDCRINLVYGNQCAVVIAGIGYSRSQEGPTVEIAAAYGLKICGEAGIKDCQVYYKACSLPVQVQ
ncbi:DUF4189 domain-containing protein [Lysobacter sp. Root559]|uniref:DUF4189 domain-containing protein n=1 Tax=Lysobacter sp. Root559 TaxID=1736559 RepID=UPI0009EB3393|nr:DUF4189 domain-containing protein [Lysobacter sp. Root559]